MDKEYNHINQPLVIVGFTTVLLLVLSILQWPHRFFHQFPKIDVLSQIRTIPSSKTAISKPTVPEIKKTHHAVSDSTLFIDFGQETNHSLATFYKKLDEAKAGRQKVRIAYLGDSFIEGDQITGDIRAQLQSIFGGSGIGFMPMQSPLASLYQQVMFEADGWSDHHFRDNPFQHQLWISGHTFLPEKEATTNFTAKKGQYFTGVKLYTGKTNNEGNVTITIDGSAKELAISANKLVTETVLNPFTTPIKSVSILSASAELPFYGVSIESKEGVIVDNYAFRGNNSTDTRKVSREMITAIQQYLQYDLIILGYGINAIEHDKQTFKWYEESMGGLINSLNGTMPQIPILLVSVGDMARKYDDGYQTDKAVPYMVATQQQIAQKHKIAFWDLYESMGGHNTMVKWVEGDTVLAYKDYTHVNSRGATRIAKIFVEKLLASKRIAQSP